MFNNIIYILAFLVSAIGVHGQIFDRVELVLQSDQQTNYYAHALVGSPPGNVQTFLFDTGATKSWLVSNRCVEARCHDHTRFIWDNSSSYQTDELADTIDYGPRMGLVGGQVGRDSIKLSSGVVLENFTFVAAFNLPDIEVLPRTLDGIIAMDLSTFRDNAPYKNPLKLMREQEMVEEQVFSIVLARESDPNFAGAIIFGRIRHDYFTDNIVYAPLTNQDRWQFQLGGISIRRDNEQSVHVCQNGCQAVVSSGMPLILGPREEVKKLNDFLGFRRVRDGRYILPNCNTTNLPSLLFKIQSAYFVVAPDHYILQVSWNPVECVSGIFEGSESFWVLGQNFMTPHYVIFDYGNHQIGFVRENIH